MKTQPSCSLCSLCCTFLKSGRLLCRLQLFGCHVILRVSTVAVHFLLCVYLLLADVDGCLASAWLGCQIFVRYSLERQSGRNEISVCSLSRSLESCNRHMRWHKTKSWHQTVGWWTGQADGAVGNCANDSCLAYYFGAFQCDIFVTAESRHWFDQRREALRFSCYLSASTARQTWRKRREG